MYLILIACVIISPIGCLLIWEFLHYNMYSDIDFFPPSIVFQKVSVIKFYQMSLLDSNTCICGKKAIALRMSPFSKCLVYITTGPENLIIVVKRLKQKFNWNPLMRIRLIAEFHLASSSLSLVLLMEELSLSLCKNVSPFDIKKSLQWNGIFSISWDWSNVSYIGGEKNTNKLWVECCFSYPILIHFCCIMCGT